MPTRLEKSLQRDIDQIRNKVIEMGTLAETAVAESLQALTKRDYQRAYAVILHDRHIDDLEKQLDRLCQEFLVRQQPAAGHLRFVYSVIKINNELERIGDYAESIARQALDLSTLESHPPYQSFIDIANVSIPMLRNAIQSFREENAELAKATMEMEKQVDNLRYSIYDELDKLHDADKLPTEALPPLMIVASRFERVADQACNVCEEVLYMCTGENIKHEGKGVFRVLFVDEQDSCRGQMAEGIGKALGLKQVRFSSAGISPKPLDQRTIEFMAGKGIDISGQSSKYLNQTLDLGNYAVIVSLCKEAEEAFPPPPTKTVRIRWHVDDPSAVQGSEAEIKRAFEKAFKYLDKNIRNMVQAIIGENVKK